MNNLVTRVLQVPATTVAEDHQMKNALAMANAGVAHILPEHDLNAQTLATAIQKILGTCPLYALLFPVVPAGHMRC